jgi:hypothetical protein
MSRHRHRGFFIRNAYQRMKREYRLERGSPSTLIGVPLIFVHFSG